MIPATLDPLRFPLRGSRLIEASAGTGKTFTIATLYLRLVLDHGGEQASFGRALTPPEILVVTFTEAATQELRERIRARLAEAAERFLAEPDEIPSRPPGEDPLHDLRAAYPPEQWPACARRLRLAAEWMDEAAISTIHGWCNRMLREHAFDSDSLFAQRLETDQEDLLAEAARDYWRIFLYPLTPDAARQTLARWRSPEALLGEIKSLLDHAERLPEGEAPSVAIERAEREKRAMLAKLKAPWAKWLDELRTLIDEGRKSKRINGSKLRQDHCEKWFEALKAWRDDPALVSPALTDAARKRLTPTGMADAWKPGFEPPQHPALDALGRLPAELAGLPDPWANALPHAVRWVAARFAEEQARLAQMGFRELLTRLDAALAGPNGARLAEAIRAQFPAAMIDEFQDTDAIQYRIFDAIYRVEADDPKAALVFIGDPKQAIYAFRGADIYTYLAARAATAGRLHTLRRNWRSTRAMVAAVNRCFELAENRASGEGAFLFRRPDGNPLPFLPAEAAGREDEWRIEGALAPALTVWRLPASGDGKPCAKGAYIERMAEICAGEITRLLNLGQRGEAGFAGKRGLTPLRPADLAVLVNNRDEAAAIRSALSARRVRSVYLSERESVFQRPEALELQRWLAACAEPEDGRVLRAALATATLGLDWASLDLLERDEIAWDDYVLQFRGYRDCWRRQGALPMLRRLLNDFRVPARLLAAEGGERRLTDWLHLAELLQQASASLDGEHALIRYLAERRREGQAGDDAARQIRLESDANLVRVVTIHKSKGLEYPLVFLPFACAFRAVKPKDRPLKWHDEAGRLHLALSDEGGEASLRADRERLGEDLRKLYVALTRARHAAWIGVAPVERLPLSAFGYLFDSDLEKGIDALADGRDEIAVIDDPPAGDERYGGQDGAVAAGCARAPRRAAREHWWIASFSALDVAWERGVETAGEDIFREAAAARPAPLARPAAPSAGQLHGFPRGAAAGTFLHELLEWVAGLGFAETLDAPDALRDLIARRCAARGWEHWIDPLCAWLRDFLRLPIHPEGAQPFALADPGGAIAEMEFWIAVRDVDLAGLDDLVRRHTLGGAERPPLLPGQLNGMLKGFIDLVVERAGRYWVIDYKSNWLGPDDDAYTAEAMRREILDARYDLQYSLYLLALHRLLKLRLPDYDYERHMGGALYLFLRGEKAPTGGLHAERPPRALIESLDRLFAPDAAGETA
jgi:exodeoxyribonuclease V beta subunit